MAELFLLHFNDWSSLGDTSISLSMASLTHKVLHHGGVVMRGWSQAQQLLTTGHGGVVDGLHVDVVSLQQTVTHSCVQLGVAHLRQDHGKVSVNAKKVWQLLWLSSGSWECLLSTAELTRMGMMWLGQLTTGRPLSMSSCLMCLTFLW